MLDAGIELPLGFVYPLRLPVADSILFRIVEESHRRTKGAIKMIRGVQFIVDDAGRATAVVIDLNEHGELWEDFYDRALAKTRRDEPSETLKSVKSRLARFKRRRSGA